MQIGKYLNTLSSLRVRPYLGENAWRRRPISNPIVERAWLVILNTASRKKVSLVLALLMISTVSACRNDNPAISTPSASHVFVKSKPGYATVHGQLVLTNPANLAPQKDGIFLSHLQEGATVVPPVATDQAPRSDVDEATGEFIIPNVEPGRYAVVVLTESGLQVPAHLLQADELAIVSVKDSDLNHTIDLGQVRIP